MALSLVERDIYVLRLDINNFPRGGPDTPLPLLLDWIEEIFNSNDSLMYLDDKGGLVNTETQRQNDPRNSIYIADYENDKKRKFATILINRGDPMLSPSSLINSITKTVNTPTVGADESVGYSAHIVVDYDEQRKGGDYYKCYLERVPSISRSLLVSYFNKKFSQKARAENWTYYSKASKKDVEYSPKLHLEGEMSGVLEEDLRNGRLSMIEFTQKDAVFSGIDLGSRAANVQLKVQVKVERDKQRNLFDWVKGLKREAAAKGYGEMKLHIRDLPAGRDRSPRFRTDHENAAEFLFMKVETITDFISELTPCTAKINADLRDRILLLRA